MKGLCRIVSCLALAGCAHGAASTPVAAAAPVAMTEPVRPAASVAPPVVAEREDPPAPADLDQLEKQAETLLESGDYAEAETAAQEVVRRDARGYPYAYVILGDVAASREQRERALADYARALELDPSDAWAATRMAQVFADMGRSSQARTFLQGYLEHHPTTDADPYDELGWLALEQQDLGEARRTFTRARDVSAGRDADAFYGLAIVAADLDDVRATADALAALLALDPSRQAEVDADPAFDSVRAAPLLRPFLSQAPSKPEPSSPGSP